jgi:hypothetical protein
MSKAILFPIPSWVPFCVTAPSQPTSPSQHLMHISVYWAPCLGCFLGCVDPTINRINKSPCSQFWPPKEHSTHPHPKQAGKMQKWEVKALGTGMLPSHWWQHSHSRLHPSPLQSSHLFTKDSWELSGIEALGSCWEYLPGKWPILPTAAWLSPPSGLRSEVWDWYGWLCLLHQQSKQKCAEGEARCPSGHLYWHTVIHSERNQTSNCLCAQGEVGPPAVHLCWHSVIHSRRNQASDWLMQLHFVASLPPWCGGAMAG